MQINFILNVYFFNNLLISHNNHLKLNCHRKIELRYKNLIINIGPTHRKKKLERSPCLELREKKIRTL